MSCVADNIVSEVQQGNSTLCVCHRGYYGQFCENNYDWYSNILIVIHILHTIILVFGLVWVIARVKYVYYLRKHQLNLANVALIITTIAIFFRLIYLWLPSRSILRIPQTFLVTYLQIFFVHGANTLWTLTILLIMGFWRDVFLKITNVSLVVHTTRIILIWSGIILLFAFIGMILIIFVKILQAIGLILVFTSLCIGLGMMIYFTVKTKQMSNGLTGTNEDKFRWTFKVFIALILSNSLYLAANILAFLLSFSRNAWLHIFPDVLFRVSEMITLILILLGLDYDLRAIRSLGMNRAKTADLLTGTTKTNEDQTSEKKETVSATETLETKS